MNAKTPSRERAFGVLALFSLLFSLAVCQHYIWSDLFVTEFHADFTDTLLWAQAAVEGGKLINPDFAYCYYLPLGGQLLMIPWVCCFGLGMLSLRASMCAFVLLFAALIAGALRSMKWRWPVALSSTAFLLLCLTGTKKLREIFFGHIIYYSQAICFLLAAFVLLVCFLRAKRGGRLAPCAAGLGLFAVFAVGSANGAISILFFAIPVAGAFALERFFDERPLSETWKRDLCALLCMGGGLIAGYALYVALTSGVSTGYGNYYEAFSAPGKWAKNLSRLAPQWVSLFAEKEAVKNLLATRDVGTAVKIGVSLLTVCVSLVSVVRYRRLASRAERLFVWTHWIVTAATLFFFVFGVIANANWRLTPMLFTTLATALIVIKSLIGDGKRVARRAGILLAAVFAAYALWCGASVPLLPTDTSVWYGENTLLDVLNDNGLRYGYCDDFWFCNSLTVLTDEKTAVRQVKLDGGEARWNHFQANVGWYADQEGIDRYFLICAKEKAEKNPGLSQGALERYSARQYDSRSDRWGDYVIFVYDHNIMAAEYAKAVSSANRG